MGATTRLTPGVLAHDRLLGTELKVSSPECWFQMQLATMAEFVTSYPVNR